MEKIKWDTIGNTRTKVVYGMETLFKGGITSDVPIHSFGVLTYSSDQLSVLQFHEDAFHETIELMTSDFFEIGTSTVELGDGRVALGFFTEGKLPEYELLETAVDAAIDSINHRCAANDMPQIEIRRTNF